MGSFEAPGEPGSDGSFTGGRSAPVDEEVCTVRGGWRLPDDEPVAAWPVRSLSETIGSEDNSYLFSIEWKLVWKVNHVT